MASIPIQSGSLIIRKEPIADLSALQSVIFGKYPASRFINGSDLFQPLIKEIAKQSDTFLSGLPVDIVPVRDSEEADILSLRRIENKYYFTFSLRGAQNSQLELDIELRLVSREELPAEENKQNQFLTEERSFSARLFPHPSGFPQSELSRDGFAKIQEYLLETGHFEALSISLRRAILEF